MSDPPESGPPESGPPRPDPGSNSGPAVVGGTDRPTRLVGAPARVRVPIDNRARRSVIGDATPSRVVLELEHIDAERNPGTIYGVYVNLPDNPSPDDLQAHHVGNVSLFITERTREPRGDHAAHGAMRLAMDITDVLDRLRQQGDVDEGDALEVAFRPIELEVTEETDDAEEVRDAVRRLQSHEATPVSIGRVSVRMQ